MKTVHYSVNRILWEKETTFDIITDSEFRKSQTSFVDCCEELKEEGYGYVKPIDEILADGKHKIEKYFIFLFLITDLNVKWFQNIRFLPECSLAKIHAAFVYKIE